MGGVAKVLILVWVCSIPVIAQVCTTTTYRGAGEVQLTYQVHFPGDPICVPLSLTNTLAWEASSTGVAACPLRFKEDGLYREFSLTDTTDHMRSGWSGCTDGGTACPLPPPNRNCGAGFTMVCGPSGWTCQCVGSTCGVNCPLIVDLASEGFHLTGWEDGVDFPFTPGGMVRIGWTDPAHQNGLLVLDRNGNGRIDDGTELFGNVTPQPPSKEPNGFAALAVYDKKENGGNDNDFIDPGDEVFSRLMVWIDKNHDGVSQPEEMKPLPEYGVLRIGLQYHRFPFVDDHGNEFRYRGNLWLRREKKPVAAMYDVFLVSDLVR